MNQPLTRSATDKMIAGVCGGVARSFGIDASIVRILAVVLSLFFGVVLVVYIALWLVLPLEEGGPTGFDDLKKMFSGNNNSTPRRPTTADPGGATTGTVPYRSAEPEKRTVPVVHRLTPTRWCPAACS